VEELGGGRPVLVVLRVLVRYFRMERMLRSEEESLEATTTRTPRS